jgi:hypothetical protein
MFFRWPVEAVVLGMIAVLDDVVVLLVVAVVVVFDLSFVVQSLCSKHQPSASQPLSAVGILLIPFSFCSLAYWIVQCRCDKLTRFTTDKGRTAEILGLVIFSSLPKL